MLNTTQKNLSHCIATPLLHVQVNIKVTKQNIQLIFFFFTEYCSVYYKLFIRAHHYFISKLYALIICYKNILPSLCNNFYSLMLCLLALGQGNRSLTLDPPIANHNHPIKSRPTFFLVREAILLGYKSL